MQFSKTCWHSKYGTVFVYLVRSGVKPFMQVQLYTTCALSKVHSEKREPAHGLGVEYFFLARMAPVYGLDLAGQISKIRCGQHFIVHYLLVFTSCITPS